MHAAAADPERVVVVEVSTASRARSALRPRTCTACTSTRSTCSCESDQTPIVIADAPPTDVDRAIAEHVSTFVPKAPTLQTGIGSIPSMVAGLLAEADGGDYGIHSEMFTTGLMRLHQSGKVTNRKGQFDGVSVATFAAGTEELYAWLNDNRDVAFLPVDVVNSPEAIGRNRRCVTINGALALDIHGQVVADTINGAQFSGIGGHEDFVSGPALALDAARSSAACRRRSPSAARCARASCRGSPPAPSSPRRAIRSTSSSPSTASASLQGLTVHQRGEALAAIAHPEFRDELLEAAARASGGRSPLA